MGLLGSKKPRRGGGQNPATTKPHWRRAAVSFCEAASKPSDPVTVDCSLGAVNGGEWGPTPTIPIVPPRGRTVIPIVSLPDGVTRVHACSRRPPGSRFGRPAKVGRDGCSASRLNLDEIRGAISRRTITWLRTGCLCVSRLAPLETPSRLHSPRPRFAVEHCRYHAQCARGASAPPAGGNVIVRGFGLSLGATISKSGVGDSGTGTGTGTPNPDGTVWPRTGALKFERTLAVAGSMNTRLSDSGAVNALFCSANARVFSGVLGPPAIGPEGRNVALVDP